MRRSIGAIDLSEGDDGPPIDPLADLLFTLIAAVLPAIFVLAPLLRAPSLAEASRVRPGAASQPPAEIRVDGHRVQPIIATASGLRLAGRDGPLLGLDAIGTDPGLARRLDEAARDGAPLLLIVEPQGLESAFLLEPLLAAHGVRDLRELRATEPCVATQDAALERACDAHPAEVP